MNYKLNQGESNAIAQSSVLVSAWRRLVPLMLDEGQVVYIALFAILVSSLTTIVAPIIIAHVIDTYIVTKEYTGVIAFSALLFSVYIIGSIASYIQIRLMGAVGRRVLFNLRNTIFNKLQELPVAFFNQNKAGDLISRINNDTDKLNQFFAQALMQFISNSVLIVGTGIFLLVINFKLGLASLVPALLVFIITRLISSWVKRTNLKSLQKGGLLSAEIQESLTNFKVIVVFNRLDYFRTKFKNVNDENYQAAMRAGIASNTLTPLYTLASTLAQLIVLGYGILLIREGALTIGLLVGFLLYVNNFYTPLRQLASVWSSLQAALASLDRISEILTLKSTMIQLPQSKPQSHAPLLRFDTVSFSYPNSKEILSNIQLSLEPGKTYALVGPTGGGKTTTASLMARLYDPTSGTIYFNGVDIRAVSNSDRAKNIGFILQEPFLFSGTIRENILYGNTELQSMSDIDLELYFKERELSSLLARFDQGLQTKITTGGSGISLGQKQLIAFIRAVLRHPQLLILDEATANVDTVTEELLDAILQKLPPTTTKVIIAHRLNTIENADEIFFVNSGSIVKAGTMEQAVNMLLHNKRTS